MRTTKVKAHYRAGKKIKAHSRNCSTKKHSKMSGEKDKYAVACKKYGKDSEEAKAILAQMKKVDKHARVGMRKKVDEELLTKESKKRKSTNPITVAMRKKARAHKRNMKISALQREGVDVTPENLKRKRSKHSRKTKKSSRPKDAGFDFGGGVKEVAYGSRRKKKAGYKNFKGRTGSSNM